MLRSLLVLGLVFALSAHARAQPQPSTDAARASEDAAIARSFEPSFLEATHGWITDVSTQLARPLTLVSHDALRHASWGAWVMHVEVSDGTSTVSLLLHAERSRAARRVASDWSAPSFVPSLRAAFALRIAAAWLAAHPNVLDVERRTYGGGATAILLRDDTGTTLCIDAIHPHEAGIAACWREPGAVSELDPEAFDHERRGERVVLRGHYRARVGPREITITIRIASDGAVITRQEARRAPRRIEAAAVPALGPLLHIEIRRDAAALVLSSETESVSCTRTDAWACEAVRPRT